MIAQGTRAWFSLRCGKVTASRVAEVCAKTKSGPSASRANYMAELIAERLTGVTAASFTNAAMQWGTDQEPKARAAYSFYKDMEIEEIGFVDHPSIAMTGASPDGLVGADGLVEIKCPNTATHIETLTGMAIPGKYVTQMAWQMACTRRQWCDYVSYDPRLPEGMALFVKRLHRAECRLDEMEAEVVAFLTELDAKVVQLRGLYERQAA